MSVLHTYGDPNAISDYNKVIRLTPNEGNAYYWRGMSYRAEGKNAQAQADFDKAKQLGAWHD